MIINVMNILIEFVIICGIFDAFDLIIPHNNSNVIIRNKNIEIILAVGNTALESIYWFINSDASLVVVSANKTMYVGAIDIPKFCNKK